MSNQILTPKRQKKQPTSTPRELTARLNQVRKQRSISEQRNTFSLPQIHGRTRCRWNSHYLDLPYFHIVETSGNLIIVHILLYRHRQILTLVNETGSWQCKSLTPEEDVAKVVQCQHLHTGHLYKISSRSKMDAVSRTLGIKRNKLPKLTDANADIIIHSSRIYQDLHKIRSIAQQKEAELEHRQ